MSNLQHPGVLQRNDARQRQFEQLLQRLHALVLSALRRVLEFVNNNRKLLGQLDFKLVVALRLRIQLLVLLLLEAET